MRVVVDGVMALVILFVVLTLAFLIY